VSHVTDQRWWFLAGAASWKDISSLLVFANALLDEKSDLGVELVGRTVKLCVVSETRIDIISGFVLSIAGEKCMLRRQYCGTRGPLKNPSV